MTPSKAALWSRFQQFYTEHPSLGLAMDISRVNFPDNFLTTMERPMQRAYIAMAELEKGGIANPDEKRMVGHYWLRAPAGSCAWSRPAARSTTSSPRSSPS